MCYIKLRKISLLCKYYEYQIFSDKKKLIATSTSYWKTERGAVRAAVKVATDLGIEYRD